MGFRNLVLDSASLFEVQFNFFCELKKIVFKLLMDLCRLRTNFSFYWKDSKIIDRTTIHE